MVVIDQNLSDVEENTENVETENSNSDSENTDKEKLKTKTDTPPTELERLKVFTQKVARCAAKSFCETYVRPLVIKNPNTLPQSTTIDITNQKQDESAIAFNPGQKTEDQGAVVLNPKEEEEDHSPLVNARQERQEESERQAAVVNPAHKQHITNFKEEEMVTIDKNKPGLTFDIVNILSYLPCQSLIAASEEKDKKEEVPMNLDSLVEEPAPCGTTCKCSKSHIEGEQMEKDDEDTPSS